MNRERIYWIVIGAVAVALASIFFFWLMPLRARVRAQRRSLVELQETLDKFVRARDDIPAEEVLKAHNDYRVWLEAEYRERVLRFFTDSDATLEAPLVEEASKAGPTRFKAGYQTMVDQIERDLLRSRPNISLSKTLFAKYPWAAGGGLPSPAEYKQVTNDINIRKCLTSLAADAQAMEIQSLTVGDKPRKGSDGLCDYIPVSLAVVVPPEKAAEFVRNLLQVSWRKGQQGLCVSIRKLHISAVQRPARGAQAGVLLRVELDVLDFPDNLLPKPS